MPGAGHHITSDGIQRRALLTIGAASLVAGCAESSSRSPFLSTILNFRRPAGGVVDREKVEALPYASLKANFEGGASALMVLGQYLNDDRLAWYSADKQLIVSWGAFVTRLIGMDVSLVETRFGAGWSRDVRALVGKTVERSLDFESAGRRTTVTTVSHFKLRKAQAVKLLSGERSLLHISEHVRANKHNRYQNDYWVDSASGFCWRSEQVVIPTMPRLNLEITKAPRG